MKIQNINLTSFGLTKITHKKAYKRNIKANDPQADTFSRSVSSNKIFKSPNPNDDYCFDRLVNKKICVASADGKTILSKEIDAHSIELELVESQEKETKTTKFKVDKKTGEQSECSYKISKNGKTRKMALKWNYPGKEFNYKGSPKDMVKLRKAIQNLRNTIHLKEYSEDFGYIREINTQFKATIEYLQNEIDNMRKY